jgi:hypothetical protein
MSITISIDPPGYRDDNIPKELLPGIDPVIAFYGDCVGIAIVKRDLEGNHLSFMIIIEDDGWWGECHGGNIDSYWLPEMAECLREAHRWLISNAKFIKNDGWEAKR